MIFFANLCPAKSVKAIKFNAHLVLDDPDSSHVFAEFASDLEFVMYGNDERTNMVCSGITASTAPQSYSKPHISLDVSEQPTQDLTKDEVYKRFTKLSFP